MVPGYLVIGIDAEQLSKVIAGEVDLGKGVVWGGGVLIGDDGFQFFAVFVVRGRLLGEGGGAAKCQEGNRAYNFHSCVLFFAQCRGGVAYALA